MDRTPVVWYFDGNKGSNSNKLNVHGNTRSNSNELNRCPNRTELCCKTFAYGSLLYNKVAPNKEI
jgi:hypothetical protein